MIDKRYQVFVSSTYQDLELERQEVMHALLELDCIPSGMELFLAANDTQWNLIKKLIDDCDYYILIIGGRYGSLGPEGLSYTEMEYRYALDIRKPIIAFIHRNPGKIIAEKTESTSEGKAKLNLFRTIVEKRICKHWETPSELGSVVSRSLVQLIKNEPAVGWIRASELPNRDAMAELLRLRRQVDELQSELNMLRTTAPKGSENLAQGTQTHTLNCIVSFYSHHERISTLYEIETNWDEIFNLIAPLMINEIIDKELFEALEKFVAYKVINDCKTKNEKLPDGAKLSLRKQDYHTVIIQLRAVGLIEKSNKSRSIRDSELYWSLTRYGDERMTQLRAIKNRDTDNNITAIP